MIDRTFAYRVLEHISGDGDTPLLRLQIDEPRDCGFGMLTGGMQLIMAFRLSIDGRRGIDTPDPKSGMPNAAKACKLVGAFTAQTIRGWIAGPQTVIARSFHWDKFGGRIDADVIRGSQDSACALLLAKGYAHPFDPSGPKIPWTDPELQRIISELGQ